MRADVDQSLWRQRYLPIGLDESGWGAWAGPLYAACVVLDPQHVPANLNDSKQLSAIQRLHLYECIVEQARAIGVGTAAATYFNQHGAAAAWQHAMRTALYRCLMQLPPVDQTQLWLLVDGVRAVAQAPVALRVRTLVAPRLDGQSSTVAAASIVAKVERDSYMTQLALDYPHYGFARHKGYGTDLHRSAISKLGLLPIHRLKYVNSVLLPTVPVQRSRPTVGGFACPCAY